MWEELCLIFVVFCDQGQMLLQYFHFVINAWMDVCVLPSTGLWTGPVSQQPPCSPGHQSPLPPGPQNSVAVWFLDPGLLFCPIFIPCVILLVSTTLTFLLCTTVQCQLWQRDTDALCKLPWQSGGCCRRVSVCPPTKTPCQRSVLSSGVRAVESAGMDSGKKTSH